MAYLDSMLNNLITITKVANGYMAATSVSSKDTYVFATFTELVDYLALFFEGYGDKPLEKAKESLIKQMKPLEDAPPEEFHSH